LEEVFAFTKTLIKNGVFGAGLDHYKEYFENEYSGLILNGDIACGQNMLRRGSKNGETAWKITEEGMKYVENDLLPHSPEAQELIGKLMESHGKPKSSWRK
jgi:hypothetical protein